MSGALAAFVAGLVSFATPCVLPLVPAYLSSIGARAAAPAAALRASLPFVAGFSAVFVGLGAAVGLIGSQVNDYRQDLLHAAGIVVVAMGFVMLGLVRVPLLERSLQPGVQPAAATGSAVLLGGAFALCWTPCVGPVLGAILALAASGATVARGAALLAAYSAGLAVPFLLASVALGRAMATFRVVRDHYGAVRMACGLVLVAAGLLVFFDRMYLVNVLVNRAAESL